MNKYEKAFKTLLNKFKIENFELEDVKLADNKLEDGTIIYSESTIEVGTALFTDAEMTLPVEDKEYTLEDGTVIVVMEGKVSEIKPKEEVVEEVVEDVVEEIVENNDVIEKKFNEAVLVDDTIVYYDGELAVGTPLFSDAEMVTPVVDGEITTIDGEIIITVGGVITEITSIVTELAKIKTELNKLRIDNKDLNEQVIELTKSLELSKKNELKLKKDINNGPALDSIKFNDDTIVNTKSTSITRSMIRNGK